VETQVNVNDSLVPDVVKDSVAVQAAARCRRGDALSLRLAAGLLARWVTAPTGIRSSRGTWAVSSIDMDVGNTPARSRIPVTVHRIGELGATSYFVGINLCVCDSGVTHRDARPASGSFLGRRTTQASRRRSCGSTARYCTPPRPWNTAVAVL